MRLDSISLQCVNVICDNVKRTIDKVQVRSLYKILHCAVVCVAGGCLQINNVIIQEHLN